MLLSFFGSVVFIVAIMFFLFNSTSQIGNEIFNPNATDASSVQAMLNVMWDFIFKSIYAIIGMGMFTIGMIWNIVISFMRGAVQNNHVLGVMVTLGWIMAMFLPVLGLLASAVIQIWAWFQGSKEVHIHSAAR